MVKQDKGCAPFYFLKTLNSRYSCNHTMYGDPVHSHSAIQLACIGAHETDSTDQIASILQ